MTCTDRCRLLLADGSTVCIHVLIAERGAMESAEIAALLGLTRRAVDLAVDRACVRFLRGAWRLL